LFGLVLKRMLEVDTVADGVDTRLSDVEVPLFAYEVDVVFLCVLKGSSFVRCDEVFLGITRRDEAGGVASFEQYVRPFGGVVL